MAHWKIVRKSDLQIIDGYESDKRELQTGKYGGELDNPDWAAHLQVPDGVDKNGVKAVDDETPDKASASYETVTYEAVETGFEGNNISLVFDGQDDIATVVAAWNSANPSNNVSHNASDDTVVPSAGTVNLSGGDAGGLRLVADSAVLDAYQKEQNRIARNNEIAKQEDIAQQAINSTLGHSDPTTHLMVATNNMLVYLMDLQAKASINTTSLSAEAQAARQALVDMQTNMLGAIQTARGTRDTAVQDFVANSLPHASAGLPADVDDYYSNL